MAADGTQSPRTGQARRNWRLVAPPTRAAGPTHSPSGASRPQ